MEFEKSMKDLLSTQKGITFLNSMRERQFFLKDTTITSRVYNLWKNAGLLDSAPANDESRKWVKLNSIEYIWLNMVKDMRNFGLPFDTIKKIKEELLSSSINKEVIDEEKIKKKLIDLIVEKGQCSKAEAEKIIEEVKKENKSQSFFQLIENTFGRSPSYLELNLCLKGLCNLESSLIIYLVSAENKSEAIVNEEENTSQLKWYLYNAINEGRLNNKELKEYIFSKPHLVLPLSTYIESFIKKHLVKSKIIGWLSEDETRLIEYVREGKAELIKIKFKDEKPVLLEITKTSKDNLEDQLIKHFGKKEYAHVSYKVAGGKLQTFSITKKYKLNA